MKKILILLLVVFTTMSCAEMKRDTNTFFVDETFTIIEATEKLVLLNGETKNVRVWKIQRDKIVNDTMYIGVISDKGYGYIITDEKWYLKTTGDRLYFDFIARNRFAPTKIETVEPTITFNTVEAYISVVTDKVIQPTYINMNTLEIERRMLAIEREILSLQREYETLKSSK